MSSLKQIAANRRNALKSGPITPEGKQRSRCNAVRHGLTAETVISAFEDTEDYKSFDAAVLAITMWNRPFNGNWCCDLQAPYGGSDVQRPSRRACSMP